MNQFFRQNTTRRHRKRCNVLPRPNMMCAFIVSLAAVVARCIRWTMDGLGARSRHRSARTRGAPGVSPRRPLDSASVCSSAMQKTAQRASRPLSCARATACSQCRSRATCALQPAAANDTHAALWQRASFGLGSESSSRQQHRGLDTRPPLPEKSVFRRVLPEQLVAFSSKQGRRHFAEALASGHMEPYFPLSEQFHTQEEPTFCGLGTLTMVMNALRIDPRRRWRDETGPGWRWWSDAMFPTGCSSSLEEMRAVGTTMDDFCLLAAANGADVRMRRATDEGESLDTFRHSILASSLTQDSLVVTSFCRASLGQTGARQPPSARARAEPSRASAREPSQRARAEPSASRLAIGARAHPMPPSPLLSLAPCRWRAQAAATSRPSEATTRPPTRRWSWTWRGSSTRRTGCPSSSSGRPRSRSTRRRAGRAAGSSSGLPRKAAPATTRPRPRCRAPGRREPRSLHYNV